MNRAFLVGIGFLAVVAVSAPVVADEAPPVAKKARRVAAEPVRAAPQRVAAPVQQTPNWTGGQIGGSNGASFANNNFAEPGAVICVSGNPCPEAFLRFSGTAASYTGGPFAGYRWQWGATVFGVEGDFAWKRAQTSGALSAQTSLGLATRLDGKYGSVSQNWDSSFRLRYGMLVSPWTLVYLTGGLAVEEISGSFSYQGTFLPGAGPSGFAATSQSWSDVRAGGTVGAGVETEVWTGWKARLEYRYADFGSYTKTVPLTTVCAVGCAPISPSVSIGLRESFHTIRLGLGFDF